MQKTNRLYSLKRRVVLLTLFVSYFGVYETAAQCERWTYFFDSNNPAYYLSTFPNNCDNSYIKNGSPFLTCYWSSSTSACKAQIQDENKTHTAKTWWTFINDVQSTGDPKKYICRYKVFGVTSVFADRFVDLGPVHFQPYQSHCEIEVEGPYRKCADFGYDKFKLDNVTYTEGQRGFDFTKKQKDKIILVNRANNNGKLKSDLAGYTYPKPENGNCIKLNDPNNPNLCEEPDSFSVIPRNGPNSPEVHHVIPKKDRQTCPCGKNSMKNAVVVSRQLNNHFLNYKRPTDEITRVNMAGKKNPFPCQ